MKKIVSLILFLAVCNTGLYAKEYAINLSGVIKKEYDINDEIRLKVGEQIIFKTFKWGKYNSYEKELEVGSYNPNDGSENFVNTKVEYSEKEGFILLTDKDTIPLDKKFVECIEFQIASVNDMWQTGILTQVVPNILVKKGSQKELRREMELDALEYISTIKQNHLDLEDPLLESYIYELIYKIVPKELIDGRSTDINILIVKDDMCNVAMYPNGTLVLHSGILSTIKTEDELVAILAHEIAHYVLNHSIDNVNSALMRKKRAEFWSAVATGLTAIVEVAVAANKSDYIPGAATLSMASLSTTVGDMIVDRLGMKYNHKQEQEADRYACQALKLLGYDENAMASVLERIRLIDEKEQVNSSYIESYTHPALVERIELCGKPKNDYSQSFECMMALPIKYTAELKYENRRFRQAIDIADINIKNKVALPSDYAIKINCSLALCNRKDVDLLQEVNSARILYPKSLILAECEIKVYLRLKDYNKVLSLLSEYETVINQTNISDVIIEKLQWIKSIRRRCELYVQ